MLNKLLQRQVQKYFGSAGVPEVLLPFLESINASYEHFEQDRLMLECSIEISSAEMFELNKSQQKAHEDITTLFDNMDEVFFSLGITSNRLLQMSPACEKVYGYAPADFKANSNLWFDLVLDEDKVKFNDYFNDLYRGKPVHVEYRIRHKDNSERWVETKMSLTKDKAGNLIHIVGITSDVTKRKHAEIAGISSESKFKSLFDRMLDGFYKSSVEGKFLEVNPALVKMLGYSSKEELMEIDIKTQLYFEESERNEAIEQGGLNGASVFRLKKKDGSEIWVEDRGQYITDDDGNVLYHDGIMRDITERVRNELRLKSSQKETADYRSALDQSLIVSITDQLGKITYANERFCEISKFTFEELVGKDHGIVNSGYHPREYIQELWSTISTGKVWRGELRNKAKDGSYYWLYSTIIPFLNEQGEPYQYLSIRTDITDKKNADLLIAENESKFRTIIQSSNDLIQSVNSDGTFDFVNDAWLRTLGYTLEEVKLMNVFDVICESHHEYCRSNFKCVQSGESVKNIRSIFITKSGSLITLEGNAVPVYKDGLVVGGQTFLRDVTEFEKAQQEILDTNNLLKIHLERLTEAQQTAKLGSWTMDILSHTFQRSEEFFKIFEVTEEECPNHYINFLDLWHPDDREKVDGIFTRAVEKCIPYQYEGRLLMKDGRIKYIFSNGKPLENEFGEYVQMHGTVQDITDRKEAERELERNIIDLKRTNSELDKFVYSVSHDLRAPLSSMLGVIELSEDDTTDVIMLENLSMLKKNVKKLDGFIADILDYSRNARIEGKKEEINFNELLNEITQNLKFMGGNNRLVDISVNVNSTVPIHSDRTRLNIILNNLVSNAIRYQNPQVPNPFVDIKVDTTDTETGIIIRDNGIGIKKDHRDKIFDMFFRVSERSVGSGLGLYIVYEAVKKLNGDIKVESEIGKGSTFTIKIPNS